MDHNATALRTAMIDTSASAETDFKRFLQVPWPDPAALGDRVELHRLCQNCARFFENRPFSHESSLCPFERSNLGDYYRFHGSLRNFCNSVERACHFCTMMWPILQAKLAARFDKSEPRDIMQQSVLLKIWLPPHGATRSSSSRHGVVDILCEDMMEAKVRTSKLSYRGASQVKFGHENGWYDWKRSETKYHGDHFHPAHTHTSTASEAHMALCRYWVEECSRKHSSCSLNKSDFMPTRLLDLGTDENDKISVCYPSRVGKVERYCTLSHTWGGVEDALQLRTTNIDALQKGVPLRSLPKTFREAAIVVRALTIRYLWIDSLCILQDSVDDWTREAGMMGSVYANTTCNIIASAARNPHQGLFSSRNPLTIYDCLVSGSIDNGTFANPWTDNSLFSIEPHLATRGWILQELTLPPRLLNFSADGISWACLHGEATEFQKDGVAVNLEQRLAFPLRRNYGRAVLDRTRELQRIFGDSVSHVDRTIGSIKTTYSGGLSELKIRRANRGWSDELFPETIDRYWRGLVHSYTACELTRPDDKLVALSAIVQQIRSLSGYTYKAGLWIEWIMSDLLWSSVHGPSATATTRPSKYRAPSWSWASVEGQVALRHPATAQRTEALADFQSVDCATHPLDTAGTGKVLDASLFLSAKLRRWTTGFTKWRSHSFSLRKGDRSFGDVYFDEGDFDHEDPRWREVYLCPLRKQDHSFTKVVNHAQVRIYGLVLVPHAGGQNHYQRLGIFDINMQANTIARIMTDDAVATDIVLR
ncbi:hypothetical protein S40285_02473 [Stachybotrys chlorohalonatus IBT 40285]|uniref:Heterokaryon incompatibility domain-containing protein n=1 Tax=Stachybotrys chlorohalonatus (strain IBT 40285) TaxID=1283841 RepID=A0A084QWP7_STAC4|nr:hypothetical protein S40285_02473 [Stachybotrys chlorohalonata IBT 40285]